MSDQERMYDAPVVAAERDRLATFSYPNHVSCKTLDTLKFASLIDAGAGGGNVPGRIRHRPRGTLCRLRLQAGDGGPDERGVVRKEPFRARSRSKHH